MTTDPKSGILLFAHGARDPLWAEPFHRLIAKLNDRNPALPASLAFLESMQPDLTTAVGALAARGVERITLVPLFMARGGHLRRDLPEIVARACAEHPGVLIRTTDAIGEVDLLLNAITDWALEEHERTGRTDLGYPVA
jgi:sirohydrochlorin cobaltochelatase